MDAALQFLTSEHTVDGMTFQNWMLVLLIIAGVISTAIAMTLRGRRAATAGPPPDSDREQRTPSGSPRTPDGEIVDGDDDDEKKP